MLLWPLGPPLSPLHWRMWAQLHLSPQPCPQTQPRPWMLIGRSHACALPGTGPLSLVRRWVLFYRYHAFCGMLLTAPSLSEIPHPPFCASVRKRFPEASGVGNRRLRSLQTQTPVPISVHYPNASLLFGRKQRTISRGFRMII